MAQTQVIYKVPIADVKKISGTFSSYIRDECCRYEVSSITSSAEVDTNTADTTLSIPLDLPESSTIQSITIPLEYEITNAATDGASCAVTVDGTQYGISYTGEVDSGAITHLNNYRAQNGVFPEFRLLIGSWLVRPSSGTSYVRVYLWNPSVTCLVDGGTLYSRPSSDISVGHGIMDGFSSVYQLLNESTPDGDATYITTTDSDPDDDEPTSQTSIVGLSFTVPRGMRLNQLRIVLNAKLKKPYDLGGTAKATVTLSFNGSKAAHSAGNRTSSGYPGDYAGYTTTEGVVKYDAALIEAINSYIGTKNTETVVDLQMSIETTAEDYYNSTKGTYDATPRVSAAWIEAVYEVVPGMNIHRKVNGVWAQAQTAYQKRGGAWVEITEDECKEILAGSFCTK